MTHEEISQMHKEDPGKTLDLAIEMYSELNPDEAEAIERWMELGFKLAMDDGWRQLPPVWYDDANA